jgi:hypothetical protein
MWGTLGLLSGFARSGVFVGGRKRNTLSHTCHSVPRSRTSVLRSKVLHAVNEMVESANWRPNHQCRCSGRGTKPPNGAEVKSLGAERFGKVMP